MNKKHLKYILASAVLSGAAFSIKKVLEKSRQPKKIYLDFTGDYETDHWNPMDILKETENKNKTAKALSAILLKVAEHRRDEYWKIKRDILASVILYADKSNDNTLMHVCDILAEIASLGKKYDMNTLPKVCEPQWVLFEHLPYDVRQNLIESIIVSLEKYDIDDYVELLQKGDIRYKDFLLGKYDITIIEPNERPLLSKLFECMLIAFKDEL